MMHLLQINCFGGISSFKNELSGYDLFVFTVLSILVLVFLSFYYRKVSKEHIIKLYVCGSTYDLKEILLQDITSERNYLQRESTSIWVKAIFYFLIIVVALTTLFTLFGIQ
ncbi:hypothetical protein [Tenacibaculum sp. nBUS_03]|uniref:hypothetical protein n=1 Tax=Tenacibaculum sp. nBUS_03 TaxID=3395320 RepID=UPI003EBE265C